ncbi:MAG TPA: transglycosylase SLT domain-containing protein [Bryobacteraceae bacterium]|nr:transglycosylase SLT domain-containing protein [Bryobacteraceae bacterium]
MSRYRPLLAGLAVCLGVVSSSSQAETSRHSLPPGLSFANAAAAPAADGVFVEDTYSTEQAQADASQNHSSETDRILSKADSHFDLGRQFYFQDNLTAARREFDAAVDLLLDAPDSLPDHTRIERRLDTISDVIYRFDVEKLGAGRADENAASYDEAPIDEISHMTFQADPSLAPKLKAELNGTTSGIPLELADPVLSYVHYFSTDRGRNMLLTGFRRSGRYKGMIQRIFAEEGVPQELIYLAQAESGFLPRAISNKKAVGMWQFIPGTGSSYSLDRTSRYDDRFDPEKATRGAAKYLKDLYARYNDWYLAMAAYNCGAGAVDRAVERTGYADYWELLKRHALPKETANYVPIIVAMTIMAKNPKDYGLENIELDPPIQYDTIHLAVSTNLNLIADAAMQPMSDLRDLNPALLTSVAPAGFDVHVPKGSSQTVLASLNSVPAENRVAWRLHHVQNGDTLQTIARSYHLTPGRIAAVNQGAESLEAGNVLLIPAAYHPETIGRSTLRKSAYRSSRSSVSRSTHISAARHVTASTSRHKGPVQAASLRH